MQLFRYSFINAAGQYVGVNSTGHIYTTSSPVYLTEDPADWNKMQVAFNRSTEKHGIFRKATIPLKFHGDAGKIVRNEFYNNGIKGYLKLIVDKRNVNFTPANLNYSLWYSCEIDFGTSTDGDTNLPPGNVYFVANLIELGVVAMMDANDNTPYEIPIYTSQGVLDPQAVPVRIGDISLSGKYRWVIPRTTDASGTPTQFEGDGNFPVYTVSQDTIFDLGTSYSSDRDGIISLVFFDTTYTFATTLRIKAEVNYYNDASASNNIKFNLRLLKFKSDDLVTVLSAVTVYADPGAALAPGANKNIFINTAYNVTFEAGYAYRLDVEFVPGPGGGLPKWSIVNNDGEFIIDAVYVMPDVTVHGFRYIDLMKKLVAKMTNGTATAISNYLQQAAYVYNSRAYNCICIPGIAMRGLENPVIKTTFSDFRQDLKMMYGIGQGIEGNTVTMEQVSNYYRKNETIYNLPNNGPVQKTFANDYVYNRIRVGTPDNTVDEINGQNEFCCEQVYTCGITSPEAADKEMNLSSTYIHGMYSIANLIAYKFRDESTSTSKDNEVCVIEVGEAMVSGAYEPRRGIYGGGIPQNIEFQLDAFNVGHSPKSCILRNFNLIKSPLPNGTTLKFQTASRPVNMYYSYLPNTTVITERSDITVTEAGAAAPNIIGQTITYPNIPRIFKGINFVVSGQLPDTLLSIMEAGPYGVIRLNDNGVPLAGFVLDSGITPDTEDAYNLRLLCSPDVDLTTLIHG